MNNFCPFHLLSNITTVNVACASLFSSCKAQLSIWTSVATEERNLTKASPGPKRQNQMYKWARTGKEMCRWNQMVKWSKTFDVFLEQKQQLRFPNPQIRNLRFIHCPMRWKGVKKIWSTTHLRWIWTRPLVCPRPSPRPRKFHQFNPHPPPSFHPPGSKRADSNSIPFFLKGLYNLKSVALVIFCV